MTKTKENKFLAVSAGLLAITTALFVSPGNIAQAELAPGSVQLDADFGQKVVPYLLSQPVIAGPFTGSKETDMDEILPFYTSPLTKYNLSVESTGGKQSVKAGEELNLNGKISYSFDAKESQEALGGLKDCKNCPSADVYRFPTLPDVGVFAQIWRKDEDKVLSQKGDYLVDEFYAAQGLSLIENKAGDFNVKWQVPEELKSGDYYLFFFVNSGKRFNLVGTPLVAFQQAATFNFRVTNDNAGNGIELDKNNIQINDKAYVYRQPAPEIAPDNGKITVSMPLTNLSPESQDVKISYKLYGWGQEDPADLVDSQPETKAVASGDKSSLEYTFNPSETGSVYNLEIRASTLESVSTSNVRLVVKGMNRGIFRYLGQAQNSQGKALPVFCLRNAAWNELFHGKVKITALDAKGKALHSFEKEGSMRPEDRCFVIKDATWLDKTVRLQGEMFDDSGRLVDKKIAKLALAEGISPTGEPLDQGAISNLPAGKLQIILFILLIIALGTGGYLILLRSKKEE